MNGPRISLVALALAALPACSAGDDPPVQGTEPVANVGQAVFGPGDFITYAITAVETAKKLYDGVQWINCVGSGFCPKTDAQAAADRVILNVESTVERIANDGLIGRLRALLDRSVRDFNDLSALGQMGSYGEEAALVNEAESLFEAYVQRLNDADATSEASAEASYALAPSFMVLAALLDSLARIELVRNQAPMTVAVMNDYRHRTLLTLDAVVGTPNLWFNCPGNNLAQTVSDVHSFDATFATRKVWKLFADYRFSYDSFSNDCNLFRHVTGARICQHDCSSDFPICKAGVLARDSSVYPTEIYKTLEKMNRDSVVGAVRDTMEKIVSLTATRSSALLWRQPTGALSSWNFLSDTSYQQLALGTDDPAVWTVVGSGDFSGDGVGDILWINGQTAEVRISTVSSDGVTSVTPPAFASRYGSTPFIGDIDGDGDADIVWTGTMGRPFQGNVYFTDVWTMNPGSAAPVAATRFQSDQVQGIGNFDNDSMHTADILFRSPETGDVSIQFGGSGYPTGIGGAPLDWQIKGVGDFNADGFADILWYNVNSGAVAAWGIQGTSIVANVTLGTSPPSDGYQIQAVADLDHDGVSDIVWRHTNGSIALWHMAAPWAVRDNWLSFAVDKNATFGGVLEMGPALPNNAAVNSVDHYYCGDQTGDFRNPGFTASAYWRSTGLAPSRGVLAGDVTGDGTTDLVGIDANSVTVVVTRNGAPSANATWRSSAFFGTRGTLLADVNGDRKADLIALGDNDVRVALAGSTSFSAPATWRFSNFSGTRNFAADVTGDGKADLIAIDDLGIRVLRSQGNTFSTTVETWFKGGFYATHGTLIGDVNADGRADLVRLQDNAIEVAVSSGSAFNNSTWQASGFWGKNGTLLGDVNGDGRADLVALEDDTVRVMRALNPGFGGTPQPYFRNFYPGGFWGNRGTFIGDIDVNGKADLIAVTDSSLGAAQSQ